MSSTESYKVIGLMSGTSIDGLDIAYCTFAPENGKWSFDLEKSAAITYDDSLRQELKESVRLTSEELLALDKRFGRWMGLQVKAFISGHQISPDFISSHGHTVFHQPERGFTYQIGSGQELANTSGFQVVCDFRSLDVSLGGQGAPLVPIGDELLFSQYDACLNLGGIANISFRENSERKAYDVCAANMLLNHLVGRIGKPYDDDGQIARSGTLDEDLLDQLNGLDYLQLPYPKSTGYEWFEDRVIPILEKNTSSVEDQLHTSVYHISGQVCENIQNHMNGSKSSVFATGGGALNGFLVESLSKQSNGSLQFDIPSPSLISYKEAIVFALMGVLKVRGEINCYSSVTGARHDSSGGTIFDPH